MKSNWFVICYQYFFSFDKYHVYPDNTLFILIIIFLSRQVPDTKITVVNCKLLTSLIFCFYILFLWTGRCVPCSSDTRWRDTLPNRYGTALPIYCSLLPHVKFNRRPPPADKNVLTVELSSFGELLQSIHGNPCISSCMPRKPARRAFVLNRHRELQLFSRCVQHKKILWK
jgi:hypothetical protein